MTPESRPLLDNGSLKHVSMQMRMHGNRLGTERAFHANGSNKYFPWIHLRNKHFSWYAQDYKSWCAEKIASIVV
jgi:hypothetical protein